MATPSDFERDGAVLRWRPAVRTGRTVLLLHGFLDAAGSWDLVAPGLAEAGYEVLALDLRGHGDGHRVDPHDYYHFPDYLLDVDRLVRGEPALAAPFVLVGHSMGGMVATLFACAFPERISHLVNVEGLGPPESDLETTPERMRGFVEGVRKVVTRGEAEPSSREQMLRRLELSHPGLSAELLATRLVHLTREVSAGRFVWKYDPLHRTRGPHPFRQSMFRRFAAQITAPVLFVSGGESGYHVPGEEERLEAFRSLARVELPGAGHMVHWTRPAELAAAIAAHAGAQPEK